ncbi:MAG: rane protein [Chlorobi bacterium]|nr:rane protein [Chlorobiota bacterium]
MTDISDANRSGFSIGSAMIGGAIWLAILVAALFGAPAIGPIELLLMLGILVFIPLAIDLLAVSDREGGNPLPYRIARLLQPIAAVPACVSFFLPAGTPAGILASAWLLLTGIIALFGMLRLIRGERRLEELCINAALLYLPIGGVWLVAARLGISLAGFGGVIALLTAVHFHFAGFIAPMLAGMTGRRLAAIGAPMKLLYRIAACGIIAGPPLVALGITFSGPLEVVAAVVLATSMTMHGFLVLVPVRRSLPGTRPAMFLGISATASVLAMLFAAQYAVGVFMQGPRLTIPQMALVHGSCNAIFALGGLLGWGFVRPRSVHIKRDA